MGGAMAPPMKDLPRWLEENPEFAVAPDWTDIVKQSVSRSCSSGEGGFYTAQQCRCLSSAIQSYAYLLIIKFHLIR